MFAIFQEKENGKPRLSAALNGDCIHDGDDEATRSMEIQPMSGILFILEPDILVIGTLSL